MVTKHDLVADDIRRQQQSEEARIESELRHQEFLQVKESEDSVRARQLLDSELGEFLVACNRKGLKEVLIQEYRSWEPPDPKRTENLRGSELYTPKFGLGFVPNPNYKPTRILLRKLRQGMFQASIVSHEEDDYEVRNLADGNYEYGSRIGSHTEYYLKISWK